MSNILHLKPKHPKREYFEGLYLKHQNLSQTLALIPSLHRSKNGGVSGSLQVITENNSWQSHFDNIKLDMQNNSFELIIGKNCFTDRGCSLSVCENGLSLTGHLRYGLLHPLKHPIMGYFRHLPFLQCEHFIFSMFHTVNGEVNLNGREYIFQNGTGYIEGDRGRSFPRKYIWTQFNNGGFSIVMAAATVPVFKTTINGCFASILYRGKEIRLATYLGARIICADNRKLSIWQKDIVLTAELLENLPHPLLAPENGCMERWIYENAACKVRYQMWKKGTKMFEIVKDRAGFEGEW